MLNILEDEVITDGMIDFPVVGLAAALLLILSPSPRELNPRSKAGVSRQTISAIEKGDYTPTIHLRLNICHCPGKTPDELFREEP